MRLYIDSVRMEEINFALDLGIVFGVTTNPLLFTKSKVKFKETIEEICNKVKTEVHVQTYGRKSEEMVKNALKLAELSKIIVIKVPANTEGIKAIKELHAMGISTTATAILSESQALTSALAGANYIAPFYSRAQNIGINSLKLIAHICQLYKIHNIDTKILVASIKTPNQAIDSLRMGAHAVTLPYNVLIEMLENPIITPIVEDMHKAYETSFII